MKRFAFAAFLLLILLLAGCEMMQTAAPVEPRNDDPGVPQDAGSSEVPFSENTIYRSNTSPEDCFLCGNGMENGTPPEWGQNNIALISLNTFEIIPVGINRYDDGQLVEEFAGYGSFGGGAGKNGGFSAALMCDHDRRYASGFINFHDDAALDTGKAAEFLCENCLNEILPLHPDRCFGVGAIDLATKKVRLFAEGLNGFALGDFYIDYDLQGRDSGESRMDILIFYCPIRYEK